MSCVPVCLAVCPGAALTICGNVMINTTTDKDKVTCPGCLRKMREKKQELAITAQDHRLAALEQRVAFLEGALTVMRDALHDQGLLKP